MCVRYIPDILNGTGAAASFSTEAEFGDDYRLWSRPKTVDKGNFSNQKSRIYPLVQTIRSRHDLPDNQRARIHVVIKMQLLKFSYSNEKVEINRIGSLFLHEYEYEASTDSTYRSYDYMYEYSDDTIGKVNHFVIFTS